MWRTILRVPNHWRAPKSPNNVASTFFNTVRLLAKDLMFEHGDAKLVFCPGRHLTSVRQCTNSSFIFCWYRRCQIFDSNATRQSKSLPSPVL